MLKDFDYSPYLCVILRKMCRMVGANHDAIDFKSHTWYQLFEWSEEDEKKFHKWLTEYFYKNRKAQRALYLSYRRSKKEAKACADSFIFNYGWAHKRPENPMDKIMFEELSHGITDS